MTKSRFPFERLVWATLLLVALGVALFFARHTNGLRRELAQQQRLNRYMEAHLAAALQRDVPPSELTDLKRKGLAQPMTQLRDDLLKHPPRIPQQGVLGGTMSFHDAGDIRFLGDGWVFAGFDDGHILGKALLRYEVSGGGKVSWKLVGSVLD